jgi:aspartyl-tRNA(Asn)/glutamyl-tRNA(Gln) amidotransferase subunit C
MADMAKLTPGDVLKLAQLARLSLSDDELQAFTGEFEEILNYVEQLQSVDTEGLAPTNQVSGNVNVMREDELIDYGYEPRELLKNVPNTEGDQIKVRRMVG